MARRRGAAVGHPQRSLPFSLPRPGVFKLTISWACRRQQQLESTGCLMSGKGDPNGWNHNAPGYYHNSKLGSARSGSPNPKDPDRHTYQSPSGPPSRQAKMKCDSCYDYNKGVKLGRCERCGNTNACFRR